MYCWNANDRLMIFLPKDECELNMKDEKMIRKEIAVLVGDYYQSKFMTPGFVAGKSREIGRASCRERV